MDLKDIQIKLTDNEEYSMHYSEAAFEYNTTYTVDFSCNLNGKPLRKQWDFIRCCIVEIEDRMVYIGKM